MIKKMVVVIVVALLLTMAATAVAMDKPEIKEELRPVELVVYPSAAVVKVGDEINYTAELEYYDGSKKDYTQEALYWGIENQEVATIEKGQLKALKPGRTRVKLIAYQDDGLRLGASMNLEVVESGETSREGVTIVCPGLGILKVGAGASGEVIPPKAE